MINYFTSTKVLPPRGDLKLSALLVKDFPAKLPIMMLLAYLTQAEFAHPLAVSSTPVLVSHDGSRETHISNSSAHTTPSSYIGTQIGLALNNEIGHVF